MSGIVTFSGDDGGHEATLNCSRCGEIILDFTGEPGYGTQSVSISLDRLNEAHAEHLAAHSTPCVSIDCPPLKDVRLEGHVMTPDEITEWYRTHPGGVFSE